MTVHARKTVPYGRDKGAADRAAAPALRAAFPKVNQLRIAFAFDNGSKLPPSSQVHILHPPSRAYFSFPCPAAGCSGTFELGPIIDQLVSRSQVRVTDHLRCGGVRPEHRATGELCALHLKYQIEITY